MPALDGLRAIAILLVLARHGVRVIYDRQGAALPLGAWDGAWPLLNGWVGVDLFFVLSGFLITYHLANRWRLGQGARPLGRYLLKRVLRIFPAYYAFLLFLVLVGIPGFAIAREDLAWRVVYHLLYLQDYLGSSIVVAFWSLGVEEKFYLAAPLLVVPLLATKSRSLRFGTLALLFLAPAVFRSLAWAAATRPMGYDAFFETLRSPFHMSFDGLVAGAAVAFLYRERERLSVAIQHGLGRRLQLWGLALLLVLLLPTQLLASIDGADVLLGSVLAVAFGACLLGVLYRPPPASHWLCAGWALFLSRISYSLYLVHMPFMGNTWVWLERWLEISRFSTPVQVLLYLPTFAAVSIAAALTLHYLVEKPFLLLKDRI